MTPVESYSNKIYTESRELWRDIFVMYMSNQIDAKGEWNIEAYISDGRRIANRSSQEYIETFINGIGQVS